MSDTSPSADLLPLSVGEILDRGIQLFRRRFVDLAKASLIPVIPIQLLIAWLAVSVPRPEQKVDPVTLETTVDTGELLGYLALLLFIIVLDWVLTRLVLAACFKLLATTYLGGEEVRWRESMSFAFTRLGSLVWLSLISFILLIPALIALVLPAIYLAVAWTFADAVFLIEGTKGRKALKRSRMLVKGTWWRVLGILLVAGLLASIIGQVAESIAEGVISNSDDDLVRGLAIFIAGCVAAVITTPLTAAFILVLYVDLRVRKEGLDLERMADSFNYGQPGSGPISTPGDEPPLMPPPSGQSPY